MRRLLRVLFAAGFGLLAVAPSPVAAAAPADSALVRADVLDVFREAGAEAHVVVLKTRTEPPSFIPIFIGEPEAMAIWQRLNRRRSPRPMTHDLFERVLGKLDVVVDKVIVDDLRDAVFLGRITFRQGKELIQEDARPSDSITLAVGAGAPILVSPAVIAKAGQRTPPGTTEPPTPEDAPGVIGPEPAGTRL